MNDELRGEQLLYGDYTHLLGLQVSGNMRQISETYREIRNLDKSLFHGFITYILALAGYCNMTVCKKWRINAKIYQSEHNCSNCPLNQEHAQNNEIEWSTWIRDSLAWAEEINEFWDKFAVTIDDYDIIYDLLGFMEVWSHNFENKSSKKAMKIIFTEWLPLEQFTTVQDIKKWKALAAVDPACSNFILVRPRIYKMARQNHEKVLQEVKDILQNENVSLISLDEFVDKFVPREKKEFELENWVTIRTEILEELLQDNPILIVALEWRKLNDVELHLKTARKEYENATNKIDFEHAIRDATYAIEELLQILYHKHFSKEAPPLATWEILQNQLQDKIKNDFGEIVLSDLIFLHYWRNYKSHPNPEINTAFEDESDPNVSKNVVFQILNRSEGFYELVRTTLNQFDISRFKLGDRSE